MDVALGQLVVSKAGRDQGRFFVVVEMLDDRYCKVADGGLRRMERPKKKNKRHLQPYRKIDEDIARSLKDGRRPADREIVEAIRRLTK